MPPAMPATAPPQPAPAESRTWAFLKRTITRYDGSKVSVARGLRNALGVAVPLAIGAMVGRIGPAIVIATGALNVGFADSTEPVVVRGRRMLAGSLLVALAVTCGCLSGWMFPAAMAASALWAFGAGMLVSLGTQTGNLGVSSICVLLIYASHPLAFGDAISCGLLALAGGLFQTILSIAPWPARPYEQERLALATLYLSLGRLTERSFSSSEPPPASGKAAQAAEVLAMRQGDHSVATIRLRALLDQGERIRICLVTLRSLRPRLDDSQPAKSAGVLLDEFLIDARQLLELVATMLRSGEPSSGRPQPLDDAEQMLEKFRAFSATSGAPALAADLQVQMDSLARQLRIVFNLANHATPSGALAFARSEAAMPWRLRAGGSLSTLRANLNFRSTVFRHAVRLAACVAAADALGRLLGSNRSYWLPLTVAVVLKPDFSTTFSRGLLRLGGTFAGLTLATILFHVLPRTLPVEITLIMVTTFLLRWTGPAHYGVLAVTVSELVVLLVALTGVAPGAVIMARARNTALGGILALLAYWLWPTWERTRVPEIFGRTMDAYRIHFDFITRAFAEDDPALLAAIEHSRTPARLARTNLEASVDRLAAEPASTLQERDHWQAILASSRIFVHSIILLHSNLLAAPESLRALGRSPVFEDFSRDVSLTLDDLAKVMRGADPQGVTFPNLREAHYRLVHSGEPMAAHGSLISAETDKIVNCLNTLREQVLAIAPGRS
jgi:uncharacterized membrane protein YccC